MLHHYLGMTTDEAARTIGIPPGTAKSRLHYATEALRAALEADARSVPGRKGSRMSTHGDVQRSITDWLEAEAVDRAPARLIETSRERVRVTAQGRAVWPPRRTAHMNLFGGLAAAGAAAVVATFGVVGLAQRNGPAIGPAASGPGPTPQPSSAVPSTTPGASTSGAMWPQSTDADVRRAQERADAGDPRYTWQIDPSLSDLRLSGGEVPPTPVIVDRFLREVLGWDLSLYNVRESNPEQFTGSIGGLVYIRCAPGQANPLYPTADELHPAPSGAHRRSATTATSR